MRITPQLGETVQLIELLDVRSSHLWEEVFQTRTSFGLWLLHWYYRLGMRPLGGGPIGWRKVGQVIWTNDGECVFTRLFRSGTSGNSAVPDCYCCVHEGGVHFLRGRFQSGLLCDSLMMSKPPWVQKEKVREGTEILFCDSWDFLSALTQLSLTPSFRQVFQVGLTAECLVADKLAPGRVWG